MPTVDLTRFTLRNGNYIGTALDARVDVVATSLATNLRGVQHTFRRTATSYTDSDDVAFAIFESATMPEKIVITFR